MDLFELGFDVNTASLDKALKHANTELRVTARVAKNAAGEMTAGFQGSATAAMSLGRNLELVDHKIRSTELAMAKLAKARNLSSPMKSSSYRELNRELETLKAQRAEMTRIGRAHAEHLASVRNAAREKAAIAKNEQRAALQLERMYARAYAEDMARTQRRLAAIAALNQAATSGLQQQLTAQRMLSTGMAANKREALQMAGAMEKARLAGATPEQLASLEQRLVLTNAATAATNQLAAAQAAASAQAAAAAALAKSNAELVAGAGAAQQATVARLAQAQKFVTMGLAKSRAEAERLAAAYLKLRAAGMSSAGLNQWVANQAGISKMSAELDNMTRRTDHAGGAFKRFEHNITRMRTGLFSILSIIAILGFDKLIRGLFETAQMTDALSRSLMMVTGNVQVAADINERLKDTADELGVSYSALAEGYAKFAIAAMGQLNAEESVSLFRSISMGLRAMGKDVTDTQRAFKALEQMAGKGVISMEELRGQLSESLPSAMRLMAKGLGYSISQLIELVSKGAVPARKALKALDEQMKLENAESARAAANTLAAAIARVGNAFTYMYQSVLSGGAQQQLLDSLGALNAAMRDPATQDAFADLIRMIVNAMTAMAENAKTIVFIIEQLAKLGAAALIAWGFLKLIGGAGAALTIAAGAMGKLAIATRGVAVATALLSNLNPWLKLLALAAGAAFWAWSQFSDEVGESEDKIGGTTEKIKAMTEAERAAYNATQLWDGSMKDLIARFANFEALKLRTDSSIKNMQAEKYTKEKLYGKGYSREEVDEMDANALAENAIERENAQKVLKEVSEKYSQAAREFTDAVNSGSQIDIATKRAAVEALSTQYRMASRTFNHEVDANLNKIAAVGRYKLREKNALKDEKGSGREELTAAKELAAYHDKITMRIFASEQAVELFNSGQAQSVEHAEELANVMAGYLSKGASLEDPMVQAQLDLLKNAQAEETVLKTRLRAMKALREEEENRRDAANETSLMLRLEGTRTSSTEDLGSVAKLVNLRMLWLKQSEQTAEKEKEITAEVRAQVELETKRAQLRSFIAEVNNSRGSMEQKTAETYNLSVLPPDQDAGRITELLRMAGSASAELESSVKDLVRLEKQVEDSLNRQKELKSKLVDLDQERLVRAVIAAPGFDKNRMDERAVAEEAKRMREADPNISQQSAIAGAIDGASKLDAMVTQTERMANSTLTMSSVWDELITSWDTGVPLLVSMGTAFADAAETARNQLGDAITNVVLDLTSARDAARELARTILREIISSIVKASIAAAASALFGKKTKGNDDIAAIEARTKAEMAAIGKVAFTNAMAIQGITALTVSAATAIASAWLPAAQLASVATMGAAVGVGFGMLSGAMAASTAMNAVSAAAGPAAAPRQSGGEVQAGKPHLVGEGGRELFIPEVSGRILSHVDTMKVLGQGADILDFQKAHTAKRAQSGGMVTAGQPVLTGEAGSELFIPRGLSMRGGSGQPITVKVINNLGVEAGVDVKEEEVDGQKFISIALNAVAEDIAKNGRVGQTLSARYGLNRQVRGRS